MQERMFVVGEERVRDPDPVGEVSGQRHAVVRIFRERQSLVLPILIQVDGDREFLRTGREDTGQAKSLSILAD